ncbi:hypothetical protein [Parvularcula sp. IMCC14364]|uniref:hypothetical protein n=1 Tax=Parvularcula sp. IMCC14364 TaxID=3067902 RepID=UPI0027413CBE|nr:hypothetical protein [Parvularcula sp. IMCC14364]
MSNIRLEKFQGFTIVTCDRPVVPEFQTASKFTPIGSFIVLAILIFLLSAFFNIQYALIFDEIIIFDQRMITIFKSTLSHPIFEAISLELSADIVAAILVGLFGSLFFGKSRNAQTFTISMSGNEITLTPQKGKDVYRFSADKNLITF